MLALSIGLSAPLWADREVDTLIEQAQSRANTGDFDEAVALLQQAISADPNSSLAHTRLGGMQLLQQDYRTAIETFKRAIGLDQGNAEAFVGMAIGYVHTGRYPLARAALKEAERLDPSKKSRIDEVLAWLDQRSTGGAH